MSGIFCEFCGQPVVPLGGEDLCECPPEAEDFSDFEQDEWIYDTTEEES